MSSICLMLKTNMEIFLWKCAKIVTVVISMRRSLLSTPLWFFYKLILFFTFVKTLVHFSKIHHHIPNHLSQDPKIKLSSTQDTYLDLSNGRKKHLLSAYYIPSIKAQILLTHLYLITPTQWDQSMSYLTGE